MSVQITKIELYKHLFKTYEFCAIIYIGDRQVARVDSWLRGHSVDFKSTLGTRIAGVDKLIDNPVLDTFLNHPATVIMK